jgi:hypothetical protein
MLLSMVRCTRNHFPEEAVKVQPIVIFLLLVDASFIAATTTTVVTKSSSLREKVKP